MADVMVNIRLNPTLKQHGVEVLEREGVSVTEAVRRLFSYLEANQSLPAELQEEGDGDAFERARQLMRSMVGILPADASLADAREARLASRGL